MKKKSVKIKNLKKKYGQREVVSNVSMDLKKGEVIGLLGPNGAGKTTTFYMITGMIKVTSGSIFLDNQDITNMAMDKRARLGLGYLAQEPSIFTDLSVEDNLKLVLEFSNLDKKQQDIYVEFIDLDTYEILDMLVNNKSCDKKYQKIVEALKSFN